MNKKYDPKFKQETVNLALNSKQTYRQRANDLDINYKTFCNWIYPTTSKPTHQAIKSNKKPDYQELERQNKVMKKDLELRKKGERNSKKGRSVLYKPEIARYEFIKKQNDLFKQRLFHLFDMSSSGYYAYLKRLPSPRRLFNE